MHDPASPRRAPRSAFAAAVLSLLFPGLGHLYAGAPARALGFAAPPLLALALVAGLVLRVDRLTLLGLLVQPSVLTAILVLDVVLLVYRAVAAVDAWRVAAYLNEAAVAGDRYGPPRLRLRPASAAGLLAVLVVMTGFHVAVARYDLQAMALVNCIFDETGAATCDEAGPSPTPGGSAASGSPATPSPTSAASPVPTPSPLPPWDGKERLNVLLIGSDEQGGGHNTDTLIVASIDPPTGRVALFSLPRDTVDVPVPAGPARALWGTVYRSKINSWFVNNRHRADLWPGSDRTRGYNALKSILGELYGLDIRWYVEVNFDGFTRLVDALGGVTINVQLPVFDDRYPGPDGRLRRVYIPAGVQHMTGAEALVYARSRHGSSDFDRGQRQQRVLLSLRQQTDIAAILPRLDELVDALKSTVRTDVPVDQLPKLLSLAEQIDPRSVRSYVFAPPFYAREILSGDPRGYVIIPNVNRIRAAVREAFTADPAEEARREALAGEGATVWVLNGSGVAGQASDLARYLESWGVTASAPNQRPDGRPSQTRLLAYNGAETRFPATAAFLAAALGVEVSPTEDPTARVDFLVVTARTTPALTPPPAP
jgi:LCP family protein required for cell wall assembly